MNRASRTKQDAVTILIAEDSQTQAEQLKYLLEEHAFQAVIAPCGREALALARRIRPTLVITDILMPGMDGYALCKEIKSDPALKDTPVILLTSLSGPQDVLQGLECGADSFVRKPFDEQYLVSRIGYILANRDLRSNEKIRSEIAIRLGGRQYFINSERQQILDLLISTYEEAVRLNEELAGSQRTMHALYNIAAALNTSMTEQDVVAEILARALELPGVEAGWIALREGETGFRIAAARGLPPALEAPGALEGDCLCRRMLLAGKFDHVTNILECERLQRAQGDTRGLCYHASVPLVVGDRTIGVMNLARKEPGLFSEEQLRILESVGNQIAVALERAQLLGQLEKRVVERTAALAAEITERKKAQEELDRFFMVSPEMLCISDFEGRFQSLNRAWEKTLGFKVEELLGKLYLEFVHPEDRPATLGEAEKVRRGEETTFFENRYLSKDGSYKWLSWTATPVVEEGLIYAAARDMTEQKQLETQLRQALRLEAVGRLAGGVAHDFNNLLNVILGYSALLLERLGSSDSLRKYADEIRKAGDRAAALTRQLLAFSRKQVLAPKVLDLNTVVTEMVKLLDRLIGEDIELLTFPDTGLGRVKADPGQIGQVIMNMAVNARDAMPRGGKLIIQTTNVELDENYASQHVGARPGPYVMLAVSDNGCGMDAETRARVFEPFFTTKEKGKGTGLGLSTVYGIVKQSGGHIWVYSEPERGTTFKVYLPRVEDSAPTPRAEKAWAASQRGSETVLLVEDEESLRRLAREFLENKGYTVLEAGNGEEAVSACEKYERPIHLMVTDVVMPGMSGRELAACLKVPRPDMKVLYVSGYTDEAITHHGVLEAGVAFLQKPFTAEDLLRRVYEVLRG